MRFPFSSCEEEAGLGENPCVRSDPPDVVSGRRRKSSTIDRVAGRFGSEPAPRTLEFLRPGRTFSLFFHRMKPPQPQRRMQGRLSVAGVEFSQLPDLRTCAGRFLNRLLVLVPGSRTPKETVVRPGKRRGGLAKGSGALTLRILTNVLRWEIRLRKPVRELVVGQGQNCIGCACNCSLEVHLCEMDRKVPASQGLSLLHTITSLAGSAIRHFCRATKNPPPGQWSARLIVAERSCC